MAFTPFIDKHGLLRAGGRLAHSNLSHSIIHPVILPGKSSLCVKLLTHKHVSLGHCGPSLILSAAGTRVHIIGARRLARSVYRSCVVCRKAAAKTQHQMMGQIPASRLTPNPPFTICGIDYAGPFLLKKGHTQKPVVIKCYMAVFVCFYTKAVHLEAITDATAKMFIECLKRFISSRGCPSDIHSDNGGNFVGARGELRDLYRLLDSQDTLNSINLYLSEHRIQWHASPERAPHFGGLWEAAVKSAKLHLKRVIDAQRLTYEEFNTILTQVEACLNSRSLVSITSLSIDGVDALTPAHFLLQRPARAYTEELVESNPSLHRRWTMTKSRQRWSVEYIQQLQRMKNWRKPSTNLRIGDVVIINEDHTFLQQWPMARVVATHPGADGLVRVVTVKNGTST